MPSELSADHGDQSVEELRRELAEAREQQAATAEILRVISSSPTDLQHVFAVVAANAVRLCDANDAQIRQVDGSTLRLVAQHGSIPSNPVVTATRGLASGRAVLECRTVQIADMHAVADEYPEGSDIARRLGYRTFLAVPLIRAGNAIGVINVRRAECRPFSDRQIDLLKTFADQAVIAIENTRLFEAEQARTKELTESLEYQTAMADVLGIISRSPSNLQPVLDAIAASARRLCAASDAVIERLEDDRFYNAAHSGTQMKGLVGLPLPLTRQFPGGRAVLDRKAVIIDDIGLVAESEYPDTLDLLKLNTIHSVAEVPLLSEGRPLGSLAILRAEVRPFTNKEVTMLETFADQAVIAIENARLFEAEQARTRELQQALEYQTATSKVLELIGRLPGALEPVFQAMLEHATRLCDAKFGIVFEAVDGGFRALATRGAPKEFADYAAAVRAWGTLGDLVRAKRIVHIDDISARPIDEGREPNRVVATSLAGIRTIFVVPMLKDDDLIGALSMYRTEVRPFSDRQIALLTAFTRQAVIAIENTRLFEQLQTRTSELAKTVENLEIASQHKSQFVANMSHELRTPLAAILGYAELIQEGFYGPLSDKALESLTRIRSNGKHLLGLINTVLDIAKIESGQFTLNMTEYAIESVVETVRTATESLAQNKKLALRTEIAKPLPIGVGDEQRLTQVLLNLVGNAIKFTDAGEIRVTARAVNGHFTVSVSDTGPGIPAEHQARIFEQFHQVDSSNTKAKGGTGLGLAIAKQIVEMHGGRIWVESTPGKGATFQIELPTRAEPREGARD